MKNKSGIEPCGSKVLVKPDSLEEMTKGGIILPPNVKTRHEMAACYGYVIAVGPDAFTHRVERLMSPKGELIEYRVSGYAGPFAEVGDRIAFAPHSGAVNTGEDGEEYWIIHDEDITARVSEKVTQTSIESRKPFSVD